MVGGSWFAEVVIGAIGSDVGFDMWTAVPWPDVYCRFARAAGETVCWLSDELVRPIDTETFEME